MKLSRWFQLFIHWLARAFLPVLTVAILLSTCVFVIYLGSESAIRLGGLFLQLLGIAAAALGIRDTARLFGKPSLLQQVRNWFGAVPPLTPRVQTIRMSTGISLGATGLHTVRSGGSATYPSLEGRLMVVERDLKKARRDVAVIEAGLDNAKKEIKAGLEIETKQRMEQDDLLRSRIESASTDGLKLAAAGALFLAFGSILSSAAPELAIALVGG